MVKIHGLSSWWSSFKFYSNMQACNIKFWYQWQYGSRLECRVLTTLLIQAIMRDYGDCGTGWTLYVNHDTRALTCEWHGRSMHKHKDVKHQLLGGGNVTRCSFFESSNNHNDQNWILLLSNVQSLIGKKWAWMIHTHTHITLHCHCLITSVPFHPLTGPQAAKELCNHYSAVVVFE